MWIAVYLEKKKTVSKGKSSKIFENAGEALYYQDTYGGTISVLRRKELAKELFESPLDAGLDMEPSVIASCADDSKNKIL